MTRYTYPAVITTNGHTYMISSPDFPDLFGGAGDLVEAMALVDDLLASTIEHYRVYGKELPTPSDFEPITNMAEGELSWWVVAHYDTESTSENFKRIMAGLKEVHDMVSADFAKAPKGMRPISDENFRKVMEDVAEEKLFWDMVSVSKIGTTPLTVESMDEVLGRYRAKIGWDDMSAEDRVAFHGNRPMTAGFMNPESADSAFHANRPKGDDQ